MVQNAAYFLKIGLKKKSIRLKATTICCFWSIIFAGKGWRIKCVL